MKRIWKVHIRAARFVSLSFNLRGRQISRYGAQLTSYSSEGGSVKIKQAIPADRQEIFLVHSTRLQARVLYTNTRRGR